jgi:hypothetical protein
VIRNGRGHECLPAGPFTEFMNQEHDHFARDMDFWERARAIKHANGDEEYPATGMVADKYNTCVRTIYRYLRGQNGCGQPATVYERHTIEEFLTLAGLSIYAVYPDADVYLGDPEPYTPCDPCQEWVTPIAGVCPWCETQLTPAPDTVQYMRLTRFELREARLRYEQGRESLDRLALWVTEKRKRGGKMPFSSRKVAMEVIRRELEYAGVTIRGGAPRTVTA